MGKKSKSAPEYQSASYDTGGLFGSSTASKTGVSYTPESWMTGTMGTVTNGLNSTLQSMLNNDFTKDANFQAYQNQFNKDMSDTYQNSVLSSLANQGLMRSSGLQAATNSFADTLANNQLNLYDNYYNRLNNNLSNMLNTSNTLYNYMTGVNSGAMQQANAVNNHNIQKAAQDNAAQANLYNLYGQLANAAGSAAGGAR